MNKEEIEIIIQPDGRVAYTIKGVKGAACDSISELLEKLGRVEASERTSEYYERDGEVDVRISQL
ncbi:MAG: DUF2997 domain-containing protein [Caldilineaceae bacterium]|nr:DUF2997 domain-containing protein [Caldilineaceae bacterium]MCB9138341.1 DUF2997 domain-containing protein [Caldilineaceae bacterium]